MWKSSMKNKMAKNIYEHVAVAGTDSNFFALIFSIGCLVLLLQIDISFLLIFSDIDNRS